MKEPHKRRRQEVVRFHFIVLTTICLLGSSVQAEDYKYPYHDPYLATFTAAILDADRITPRHKRQLVHVSVLPGRDQISPLEGRGDLSVALYRQRRPAPLLFILSGIGTNPYFGIATYFATLLYQEGFHIVILPSPMTWNFALAASRSGAPGYAPEDARDLYEAMQKTLQVLRSEYDVKITEVNFMGASLGALEGAYLSVIDAKEQKIGIEKYLLVNPPLDLSYAVKRIDEWDALKATFGKEKSERIAAKAIAIVEPYSRERKSDPAPFDALAKDFSKFTREELQFLIAENAQTALPELVYVAQVMNEQNVLATPRDQPRRRLVEAKGWTLTDYMEKIALPLWRKQAAEPQADLDGFGAQGSLAPILEQLRANPKVWIMHNADDVFVERKAIEDLKEVMGDRMTLYPYGGHLGNLWYPPNRQYVVRFFRKVPWSPGK
jgi:hypothetical protein